MPTELDEFLRLTDNEVLAEIAKAATDPSHPGHDPADRIVHRKHFRVLYERNPYDADKNPDAGEAIYHAASREFGAENVRHDRYTQKGSATAFPVRLRDGRIVSSLAVSEVLNRLPLVNLDYVFVAPEIGSEAEEWLERKREEIIILTEEDQE